MESQNVTVVLAFSVGVLSFLSPCVLPLVPVYLSYLTGSVIGGEETPGRSTVFIHALLFVLGFSLVFVLLFGLPVGYLGRFLADFTPILVKIGGLFLIVFGLHTIGLIQVPFLLLERRVEVGMGSGPTYVRSALVGMTFAAGWTPCVGPLLGAILTLSLQAVTPWRAAGFLLAYSLGMGLPFLLVALLLTTATGWLRRLNRRLNIVSVVSGAFLIIIGFLLLTGTFQTLNSLFLRFTPSWLIERL
ncbi:MAG TPA: cytochrome c biogenesis protein CcdA [Anaerolineae bacterium]|nr:cytochrome c biogenesis protein CcdA [Anaerolineae bacterium]